MPIYFINSSGVEISLYTENTQSPHCYDTVQASNCMIINNKFACVNADCNWLESQTYNPFWDELEFVIPATTEDFEDNYFFSSGFTAISSEAFCAIINTETKCGTINIIPPIE